MSVDVSVMTVALVKQSERRCCTGRRLNRCQQRVVFIDQLLLLLLLMLLVLLLLPIDRFVASSMRLEH